MGEAVVEPASKEGEKKECCKCKHGKKVKPSEVRFGGQSCTLCIFLTLCHFLGQLQLPLYGNPYPPNDIILSSEPGVLEDGFRATREAIGPVVTVLGESIQRARQFLDTGAAHAKSTYELISDEGNAVPKAVAITSGGLLGLLLASRKGFFKKILFTAVGVGGSVAACYPKQTAELAELSAFIARKKGPELVKEYTGYDISQYVKPPNGNAAVPAQPAGDQGVAADKDLYANRSVK